MFLGLTPRRSNAFRCVGVGAAASSKLSDSPMETSFRTTVKRSASRVWKLCTAVASRASGSGVDQGAAPLGEPARVAGEVGDGLLADALSLAPVAPEQDRRPSAPVLDFVDSICHGNENIMN